MTKTDSKTQGAADREIFARAVLLALLSQPRWIIRTVESVAFIDRQTVRRRIGRHFTIPAPDLCPTLGDKVVLPVFGIPKGQFISCDLKDGGGNLVALPALPERAHYSADALCFLAERIDGSLDKTARQVISEFVTAGPQTSQERLEAAEEGSLSYLFSDLHFKLLATYLAHNYLVYVDVSVPTNSDSPARHIIRFELDSMIPPRADDELRRFRTTRRFGQPAFSWRSPHRGRDRRFRSVTRTVLRRLGLRGNPYTHILPVDGAGSLHLDVEATEGIAFGERHLRFFPSKGKFLSVRHHGASARRARFLIPRTLGRGSAAMTINVRPDRGLLREASWVLLVAFAILLYWTYRDFTQLDGPKAPLSLLLVVPGLVSVVTTRPGEHPYASSVLFFVRLLAVLPLPLGVLAGFILLIEGPRGWILGSAVASLLAGLILGGGRLIDWKEVRPQVTEWVNDHLTRIG